MEFYQTIHIKDLVNHNERQFSCLISSRSEGCTPGANERIAIFRSDWHFNRSANARRNSGSELWSLLLLLHSHRVANHCGSYASDGFLGEATMIELTRLNNQLLVVNSDLIKFIERAPDTVLTLVTGEKVIVRESFNEVLEKIVAFRRSIVAGFNVASPEVIPSNIPAVFPINPDVEES